MTDASLQSSNQLESTNNQNKSEHSRIGALWVSLVGFVLVLIILVVFILQNMQKVRITFLGFKGEIPLALGLLIAAIAGAVLTIIIGSTRIIQLRHRSHQTTAKPIEPAPPESDKI